MSEHNRPPLIVLVANMTWNIWNYRIPVIKALKDAGYRVMVFAPVDDTLPKLLRETNVDFVPLEHFQRNSTNPLGTLGMMAELRKHYRKYAPNLVIHFGVQANILGSFAAWSCGTPSISVVTGLGYTFLHQTPSNILIRLLYRISFRLVEKIVFENKQDRNLMVHSGAARQEHTHVVSGCGIDTDFFLPQRRNRSSRPVVFSYFGRLLYDKGLREFYEAARLVRQHYPNTEFRLFGTLDKNNPAHIRPYELLHWIKGGLMRYMGAVEDVRPYVAASDVVVMPSYREGLSRTLLEAMSMARPVLTTDVPGCRDAVHHNVNGLLVPARNSDALAEAMMHYCRMSDMQRQQMGWAGRQKAIREFSNAIVGRQYINIVWHFLKPTQQPFLQGATREAVKRKTTGSQF